ncbi:MAG: hypothetical protein AAF569_05695, partial [Pseudomonadota bacterium]
MRAYVESLLSDKGFALSDSDEACDLMITDQQKYQGLQTEEKTIILGDKADQQDIDIKHFINLPVRAG